METFTPSSEERSDVDDMSVSILMWRYGCPPGHGSDFSRHYFSILEVKIFTSTHDNFIQGTGIRDGVSHCGKILSVSYDNLGTSDSN